MRSLVFAVLACVGCDQVFGLHGRDAPLGADSSPRPSPTCLGQGDRVELPLLADTYLVAGDSSPHGAEAIAKVNTTSSLLARFDRGDVLFRVLELELSHAGSAIGCDASGQCATCALGTMGLISVYLTRPDWDEATATHAERSDEVAWAAPGAGGADRSIALTTTMYSGTDFSPSAYYLDSQLGAAWPPGPLSLLITTETTGAATFGTREGESACGRADPPRLMVTCDAPSSCGDGVIQPPETCDDGNRVGGDDCSVACRIEECGNGIIDLGEECDDGDTINTNGCSNTCTCGNAC